MNLAHALWLLNDWTFEKPGTSVKVFGLYGWSLDNASRL